MILEAVEVLVPLAAEFASIRFMFFHTKGAWVGVQRFRVNDRESAIFVRGKLLRVMAMLQEVSQSSRHLACRETLTLL